MHLKMILHLQYLPFNVVIGMIMFHAHKRKVIYRVLILVFFLIEFLSSHAPRTCIKPFLLYFFSFLSFLKLFGLWRT